MADDLVLLGRITGAHGIRGELLVRSFTADPADIAAYGPLVRRDGGAAIELSIVRVTDKGVIARIKGVADRNAAEALSGIELFVPREALPEPAADEFYHADLIGLAAVSATGDAIGKVVAIHNFGAGDLLEIRLAGTSRTELVPFADPFASTIDLAQRRIVIDLPRDDTD